MSDEHRYLDASGAPYGPVMEALEETKRLEATAAVRAAERALEAAQAAEQAAGYTVADLRNDLTGLDPDMRIDLEGCDCVGRCKGVDVNWEGNAILLERG